MVGKSGCGKTTTGRLILRLLEPTEGEVDFEGENIFNFDKEKMRGARRNMQIIFQDPFASLNPRMTVGDSIVPLYRFSCLLGTNFSLQENIFIILNVACPH